METILYSPLYDLASRHFSEVEIITRDNQVLKGQFVQFKVVNEDYECIYPAEKYCFVPQENKEEFRKEWNMHKGEFKELPSYIKQLGLHEIKKIIIEPRMA